MIFYSPAGRAEFGALTQVETKNGVWFDQNPNGSKSKGKVKIRSVYRPMPAHTQNQECAFLLSSRKQLNECRLRIRSGRYDGILMMKLRK